MITTYNQIIIYIDAHIKENIAASDIADITGYSVHHIYKLFRVYSPYPIMEYIRRKRLYFAANELYTGRKLLEIALDYGFDTPAGFYKAFKSVFGCSPSDYKGKIKKEEIIMIIKSVNDLSELNDVLSYANSLYPYLSFKFGDEGNDKYSFRFWLEQWRKAPELLLYAEDDGQICGAILGWMDGQFVTAAADGVSESFKSNGLHEAMFIELEKRAKALGCKGIALGIDEGAEELYAGMGYIGKTLIQSEKHSVDDLRRLCEQYDNYEITGTNVFEGNVNQIWVEASLLDRDLKKRFETDIGDCSVQVVAIKNI